MEETESIAEYFTKILTLTNKMKCCGEQIKEQLVVEKVLRTLTSKFDHIVVAIEESKDLTSFKLEELQSSLEAHEQRLRERNPEKHNDQALQAQTDSKCGDSGSSSQKVVSNPRSQFSGKKKWVDKKKVQCYNCRNFGHFAADCRFSKGSHVKGEEARLAQEENTEDDHYLLMVTTKNDLQCANFWYLDTGCSNHMSGRRE
ncbi:uncharacterized protein LOC114396741 [Glycine soja]|uniref:uncharacterized protein LOC114396741 n=1 Tax=Glycine soja TaxID=3848 RepID=UPI00103946A8|nr:uncharacterized protein LOC114396741 [Glycine soja]